MISPPASLSICLSFCPSVHLQDCPALSRLSSLPSSPRLLLWLWLEVLRWCVRGGATERPPLYVREVATFPCARQSHVHQQGISYAERQGHGDSDRQVGPPLGRRRSAASQNWSTHVLAISCRDYLLKGQFIHKNHSLLTYLYPQRESFKACEMPPHKGV